MTPLVVLDTGILQDLSRVMIRDCRYDVSCVFSCITKPLSKGSLIFHSFYSDVLAVERTSSV